MRLLIALTVSTAAAITFIGAALAPPASAQDLSLGCQTANDPSLDGFYSGAVIFGAPFAAGEQITVSAGPPTLFRVTKIELAIDAPTVARTTFPGTIWYAFPAAGTVGVSWFISPPGAATWTVSCGVPDPAQLIADLQDVVAGFGLSRGLTRALNGKLEEALAALNAGDITGACGWVGRFLNQVEAETGKELTAPQAQQLTDAANAILALLDC